MTEVKAITKKVSGIVMPAVTADEAVGAFNAYQELAKKITRPEDIQQIQGKDFKKKSFWRKCQRFFNLSLELVKEEKTTENNHFTYKFIFRAIAPNGSYVDGTGTCSSNEKGLVKTEHNTRAIAETRAKNRAIADLVAFGEVSAEEINGGGEPDPTEDLIIQAKKDIDEKFIGGVCSSCNKEVTDKVAKYSAYKFNKVLCYKCQKDKK